MKRQTFDSEDTVHTALDPSSSEAISDDPVLEPKHKIFLSHSGAQKEFVDHLCKALEERCHYPFFDRRLESLPKGVKFPGLIFKAVQQCQLFVVVTSEDYFMSKWPMLELNAYVKAMKEMKSNMKQGILPLFYGLSVSELKDEKRRQRWFEKWETFARDDRKGLIKVDDWKFALDELTKFNGLPYDRKLKQVVEYESAIVSHICKLLPPDIKWEDSHVQGNTHEVVLKKMKQVGVSHLAKVKVVGLHGVGGIGKTTVCKTLCNELSSAFEGRVCHIEFDSTSSNSKELLQKVLMKLTRKSQELVQRLDEGECMNVLYKNLMKQKTFLAIDNVWDNVDSIKQAKMFLKGPFHEESLVLLTTRAEKTLELLGIDGVSCLEMPELGQGDATNLFLHYVGNGQQYTNEEDMNFIDLCVRRCYFSKGDGRDFHYHPLALEALGRQLGCLGKSPFEWAKVLSSSRNLNTFSGKEVFDVLRSSFDLLPPIEQALFMDVGIFYQWLYGKFEFAMPIILSDCLCTLYKQDEQEMQSLLNSLKGKGLLQNADLSLGRITMHDLYREFVVLEAKGKLVQATNLLNRRWAYLHICNGDLSELEVTPAGGCWQNLTRLSIRQNFFEHIESWVGIEWQCFSNVLVLELYCLNSVKGTLNLEGMKCLRSLYAYELYGFEGLEGLEKLTNLALFHWDSNGVLCPSVLKVVVERFQRSLKYLEIHDNHVFLGLDALAWCNNLCKLVLFYVEVGVQLDLSNCLSLEHVLLRRISNLQTLLVPCTRRASRLHSFEVVNCKQLRDIPGLNELVCLKHLYMYNVPLKGSPNFQCLTKLQTLKIGGEIGFNDLHIPCQLEEFCYRLWWKLCEPLNLSGFSPIYPEGRWTYMHGSKDVGPSWARPQSLNLPYRQLLQRDRQMRDWKTIKKLDFDGCDALRLHEEGIHVVWALLP